MSDLISIALEVAENFPVFPCNSKKQPVCNGGFKAATQDPDQIEILFKAATATLIGVPTGEISGMSVIDIDVRDGKQGEEWMHRNRSKLGTTKVAVTQSGGWHFYYKHREGIRNKAGIAMCVDIRGDGGYVIVPPSEGYSWLNDEDLLPYPDFMVQEHSEVSAPNSTSKIHDAFGSIVDGREKYMSDLVYASVLDFRRENATLPSEEWMVTNVWPTYTLKVKSRTGDLENEDRGITMFMKKIRSTIGKLKREQPAKKVRGEFDDPEEDEVQGKNIEEVFTPIVSAAPTPSLWKTLNDLKNMPPPSFIVAPYLVDKSFAVLFGAPASYKSFLALDWALSIAHGIDWNGRAVEQGTVAYMALEGQSGLATRAEAWHKEMNLEQRDVPFYALTCPMSMVDELTEGSDVEKIINSIEQEFGGVVPKMIVIDTLARSFVGKDENSATDMGMFVRNIDLIRERFDCTVLAVHHSGKDSDKGMRGSSALRGAVDSEFEIVRRKDTQQVALHVRKQKDTEEAEELWMEAKEITWIDGSFGAERSSLILDPMEAAPKKAIVISVDQQIALDILGNMLESKINIEKDYQGNYGISENLWREAVCESLPNLENSKTWYNFKNRLVNRKFIIILNGLVAKANV